MKIQGVLLLFFVLLTMHSYSQELFTKELKWDFCDTITTPVFQDTTQIFEWGKSSGTFVSLHSEKFRIKIAIFLY